MLDSFEVDDSNKFAVALCKAVVNLEKGYSPLLIHGEAGSGKTHLLTAVSTELSRAHPEISLLFVSEEDTVEQVFGNGASSDEALARELVRKDFLIVDDFERILDVPAAKDKFSSLFNSFVDSGKQILLASSVPIKDLRGFDKRFLSRLRGGIDAHLVPPLPETRLKILKSECARLDLELDLDVMQMLMKEAGKNSAYLKRLPGHLKTFSTLNRQPLTKEKVAEFLSAIREQAGEQKDTATTEEILSTWMQRQAKKHEDGLQVTLREYEQKLSSHDEIVQQMQRQIEELAAREKATAADNASLTLRLKKIKGELDEKNNLLKSQGKVISSEIAQLSKELKEREERAEEALRDRDAALSEKEARISELEQLLKKNFSDLALHADHQKQAEQKLQALQARIEQLQKEKEDDLLALKIQLEDKDEKLVLLREEREKRSSKEQREKLDLEDSYAETREENELLKKAAEQLNARIKELEDNLEHIRAQRTEESSAKLSEAAAREQQLQEEINALSQALEAERALSQSREQKNATLSKRASAAESASAEIEERLKEVSQNHQRAREELERVRSEREKMKQDLSEITAELASSKSMVEQHEREIGEKSKKLEELASENLKLQNHVSEREQALLLKEREDAERIRAFHEQVKKLDDELHAAELERKKQEAVLKETREQRKMLAAELNDEIEQLKAVLKEKEASEQNLSKSLEEATAKLQRNEEILNQAKAEAEEAEARAEEIGRQFEEAQKSWEERLERQRDELALHEKDLAEKIAASQREVQESAGIIKRLKTHVSDLEDRVRQRDQLLDAKEKGEAEHILKLKDELKRRNDELQKTFEDIVAANERGDEFERRVSELAHELAAVKEERQQAEDSSAAARDLFDKQIQEARERASELETQLTQRNEQVREFESRLGDYERRIQSSEEALAALRAELAAAENEKASLAAKEQEVAARVEEVTHEAEAAVQAAGERLQEARVQLREAQAREGELLSRFEQEKAALTERLERQRLESTAREKAHSDASSAAELEMKSLSEQVQKLKKKMNEAQQDLERQVELRELAEQDAARLATLIEEKDLRVAESQKALEALRESFSQSTAQGAEAQGHFSALEKELTAKERALAAVRHDYSELQVDYDKLRAEMVKAEKSGSKLQSEKKKTEQALKSRDDQIKALQEELTKLRAQVEQEDAGALARIQELERITAKKDDMLQAAEQRGRESAREIVASKDKEIERLSAAQKEAARSLEEHAQTADAQLAKVRQEYEELLLRQRKENDVLRGRLTTLEHEQASQPDSAKLPTAAEQEADVSPPPASAEEPAADASDAQAEPEEPAGDVQFEPVEWLHDFAGFRGSEANSFTITMAEKIAKSPGTLYNPLCIYGQSGAGKTHIMHALGLLATKQNPKLSAVVISLGSLIERMKRERENLEKWPRSLRLLILDDFEISDVPREIQASLYGLLSAMLKSGTQIVIASEVPPIKMQSIEESMLHFIEAGLLAKLEVDAQVQEEQKEAIEAFVHVARIPFAGQQEKQEAETRAAETAPSPEPAAPEVKKDFFEEFLQANTALTSANFQGKELFEEFEEIFKNPNKRWRNKFPLLVMEDDRQRRNHFFNALAHRLQGVFTGPVSSLSIERLVTVLSKKQAFDWNGLLNRLIKSHVILIDDCDSVTKLPSSTFGYLRAIIDEVLGRDILLMIGMSKKYKKEPIFGAAVKRASKKKI
ncbi:MAG: hypothetical protein C4520_22055 [Candidatus Abyssobacteria bacterium SURF_5]|uniref:Chromosomal replication initiator protein DnaA n=1 Tax=Abyssobacteria bacterium (strain SURF_5) TaxID=2093360 RepID=A0A3A4MVD0_ABYX5|nr:MAG: hypothetical protein C4520_22055 [Candidatus Abyssubacteria bacterium SURF_5]